MNRNHSRARWHSAPASCFWSHSDPAVVFFTPSLAACRLTRIRILPHCRPRVRTGPTVWHRRSARMAKERIEMSCYHECLVVSPLNALFCVICQLVRKPSACHSRRGALGNAGARDRTRTCTPYGTRTSNVCVYQFHHPSISTVGKGRKVNLVRLVKPGNALASRFYSLDTLLFPLDRPNPAEHPAINRHTPGSHARFPELHGRPHARQRKQRTEIEQNRSQPVAIIQLRYAMDRG